MCKEGSPGLPFFPYARTSWKGNSANFAVTEFSEVGFPVAS